MKEYTLIVKGKRIPVTYEVYKAYYQEYEHERYLKNKAAKHEHSLEQFREAGVSIEFICLDSLTPVEDEVLESEQLSYFRCCLDKLSAEEQQIIYGIFFEEKTEKQLAQQLQISASAVGYRERKILKALLQKMKGYYK
ncbi:sigma-70 family RNA polymerase sigma factor [Clostridium sp. D2Q-14]|uniref:sigma factor-like helix-turn-helix DNA-binding protein n=1 Tax=Anaeromonas gelatinilytica TaxID=2683194 RepID=UPI00193B5A27|nr:sigma factor-like helix-turn-helix DNA-binding protein [Anaeromonas gelatinilytica]MBS4535802.1 sigma-70 family RNA polymerase sigma factor [Anaeromonas gelatinilytica]